MNRILPLVAIEVFVWFVLLLITFIISKGVIEINFGTATLVERIATQTVRLLVSGVLILVWLLTWKKVADLYLSKMLSRHGVSA
jgi:type VI protein secretion system component VasK